MSIEMRMNRTSVMALIASALYATQEDNHLNQKVAYRAQNTEHTELIRGLEQ